MILVAFPIGSRQFHLHFLCVVGFRAVLRSKHYVPNKETENMVKLFELKVNTKQYQ